MLTLGQLITPATEDEALQTVLDLLTQLGFQATSWQSGAIQLTILRVFAKVYSKFTSIVARIAAGGFTTLADIDFMRLLAKYVYDLEAELATPTQGMILFTSSAGAPTHSWIAGDILVADAPNGTDGANVYRIQVAGTINPGQALSFAFAADKTGAAGNIPPNTTLYLWTPLVGVTPTNPALPLSNTWITTPGTDDETAARLALRCIRRWARLSYGNTDGAYEGWAMEALSAVNRVSVASAPGDANVTVYAATATGPVDASQATAIQDYINGVPDGVGRRPINDIVTVLPAISKLTPALDGSAFVESQYVDTAPAAISAALLAYLGDVPLGGWKLQGSQGLVIFSDLMNVATGKAASNGKTYGNVLGVRSFVFNGLSADIPINPGELYLPPITVSALAVAPGA